MIKKLILGTANFDLNYGVKNKYKKLRIKEIKKIIIYLKKKNISYIDTAQSYNNTEKILGKENVKKSIEANFQLTLETLVDHTCLTNEIFLLKISSLITFFNYRVI